MIPIRLRHQSLDPNWGEAFPAALDLDFGAGVAAGIGVGVGLAAAVGGPEGGRPGRIGFVRRGGAVYSDAVSRGLAAQGRATSEFAAELRRGHDVAWRDWREEVPKVAVHAGCFDLKRRASGQQHVLLRLVDPMTVENKTTGEQLVLPAGTLSDGSSVPGPLWGALDANPVDLALPGFAHDFAYRRGAKWRKPSGRSRSINRYEADLLHIAIDRLLRVRKSDQAKIFYALRVGGGFAYRRRDVDWDGRG